MVMAGGSWATRVVATKVVATDGTGDFTDIQSAINDLPSGGGVVYIKEGTYNISSPISITTNNVALFGAGKATKITTTGNIAIISINASYCTIKDLFLYGAGSGNSSNYGINLTAGNSSNTFMSLLIQNCGSNGIYGFRDNVDTKILHNTITSNFSSGILFAAAVPAVENRSIIFGNYCSSNSNYGIAIASTQYVTLSNNVSISNGTDGILLGLYSSYNVVMGNICKGNSGYGAKISSSCFNNILVSNMLRANTTGGYSDSGTSTQIGHNVV